MLLNPAFHYILQEIPIGGRPLKRLILACLAAFQTLIYADSSYAVTEGVSAAIVAGAVNAITGDHYVAEADYQIQGAVPLTLPRVY